MNKMLNYNLKLNNEYFYYETDNQWELNRNKFMTYNVMNSKNNTEDELKQFVKEHTTYDYKIVSGIKNIILSLICLILSIINFKFHLTEIAYFIWGMLFNLIISNITKLFLDNYNKKIMDKIFNEDKKYLEGLHNDKKRNLSKNEKN